MTTDHFITNSDLRQVTPWRHSTTHTALSTRRGARRPAGGLRLISADGGSTLGCHRSQEPADVHERRWVIVAAVSAEVLIMGDGTVLSGVVKFRLKNLDDK